MKIFHRMMSAAVCLGVLAGVASADVDLVIRNVTVVDVKAGELRRGMDVHIDGDRIEAVLKSPSEIPAGADGIDGHEFFLAPGLIDAHVHYVDPATYGPLFLAHGVVLVREMGSDTGQVLEIRRQLKAGEIVGPDMICAGAIVDGNPPIWPFSEACDTPEEGRAAVRRLKEAGVDFIKVYQMLKPEVYDAVCDEAKKQGLKFSGHVPDAITLAYAAKTGQHTVEHLTGVDVALAKLLRDPARADEPVDVRERSIVWSRLDEIPEDRLQAMFKGIAAAKMVHCPTHVIMEGIGKTVDPELNDPELAYVQPFMRAFWEMPGYKELAPFVAQQIPARLAITKAMHDAGVTLIIGTDLANPYVYAGASVWREMELFAQAGIPVADVLAMATSTSAEALDVDDRYGSIEPGKRASVVLLASNPLDDVGAWRSIVEVMHDGKRYRHADIEALRAQALAAAQEAPAEAPAAAGLDLPGERVAEGTYRMTFSGFDAGTEEFLITRDGGKYRVKSRVMPKGGGQKPVTVQLELDSERRFVAATSQGLEPEAPVMRYRREGEVLFAERPTEGGPEVRETRIGEGEMAGATTIAAAWGALASFDLEAGESREFMSHVFGMPAWSWSSTKTKVTRRADEPYEFDGRTYTVQRFHETSTGPIGEVNAEWWVLPGGVPVKFTFRFSFGEVIAVLDPATFKAGK